MSWVFTLTHVASNEMHTYTDLHVDTRLIAENSHVGFLQSLNTGVKSFCSSFDVLSRSRSGVVNIWRWRHIDRRLGLCSDRTYIQTSSQTNRQTKKEQRQQVTQKATVKRRDHSVSSQSQRIQATNVSRVYLVIESWTTQWRYWRFPKSTFLRAFYAESVV